MVALLPRIRTTLASKHHRNAKRGSDDNAHKDEYE